MRVTAAHTARRSRAQALTRWNSWNGNTCTRHPAHYLYIPPHSTRTCGIHSKYGPNACRVRLRCACCFDEHLGEPHSSARPTRTRQQGTSMFLAIFKAYLLLLATLAAEVHAVGLRACIPHDLKRPGRWFTWLRQRCVNRASLG